jgi:hypothetical protein
MGVSTENLPTVEPTKENSELVLDRVLGVGGMGEVWQAD